MARGSSKRLFLRLALCVYARTFAAKFSRCRVSLVSLTPAKQKACREDPRDGMQQEGGERQRERAAQYPAESCFPVLRIQSSIVRDLGRSSRNKQPGKKSRERGTTWALYVQSSTNYRLPWAFVRRRCTVQKDSGYKAAHYSVILCSLVPSFVRD